MEFLELLNKYNFEEIGDYVFRRVDDEEIYEICCRNNKYIFRYYLDCRGVERVDYDVFTLKELTTYLNDIL